MTSNPVESPARAIIAGHGSYAEGMISAAHAVTGRGDFFVGVSNRGMSPEQIEGALRTAIEAYDLKVLFTDLPAGSCTIAARRILRTNPELVLVTGANLVTLIDFVFRDGADPREAAQAAADKGRASMTVSGVPGGY